MPTLLTSGLFIEHLAHAVQNYRIKRRGLRTMALELKRIKGDALTARANIEKLGTLYAKLAQTSGEHASDVEDLVGDVGEMVVDMGAIVDITKNSVASSNAGALQDSQPKALESQTAPPAIQQPEAPQALPAPPPLLQTPLQPIAHTFRAEAEQQIAAGHKP